MAENAHLPSFLAAPWRFFKEIVMMKRRLFTARRSLLAAILTVPVALSWSFPTWAHTDPLPSWNDGVTKQTIIALVTDTTTEGAPRLVAPEERIESFDQDGTFSVEQPIYSQVFYALDRVAVIARDRPELAKVEPFKTVQSGDMAAIARLGMPDLEKILAATLTGMSVGKFQAEVQAWLSMAKDHRCERPYTDLTYIPMLEVLTYFRANGYNSYFGTGGGQDCVRVYNEATYGIPREQSVGSADRVTYIYDAKGTPELSGQARGYPPSDRSPSAFGLCQYYRRSADTGIHLGGRGSETGHAAFA